MIGGPFSHASRNILYSYISSDPTSPRERVCSPDPRPELILVATESRRISTLRGAEYLYEFIATSMNRQFQPLLTPGDGGKLPGFCSASYTCSAPSLTSRWGFGPGGVRRVRRPGTPGRVYGSLGEPGRSEPRRPAAACNHLRTFPCGRPSVAWPSGESGTRCRRYVPDWPGTIRSLGAD